MPPIHQFFYISELAAGGHYSVFGAVATVARERNTVLGLTGAMVFDGERFCQLLEGPRDGVTALARVIVADPRHHRVRTLHDGPVDAGRRFVSWQNGYCGVDELDVFHDGPTGLHGARAVDAFVAMVGRCDMRA